MAPAGPVPCAGGGGAGRGDGMHAMGGWVGGEGKRTGGDGAGCVQEEVCVSGKLREERGAERAAPHGPARHHLHKQCPLCFTTGSLLQPLALSKAPFL